MISLRLALLFLSTISLLSCATAQTHPTAGPTTNADVKEKGNGQVKILSLVGSSLKDEYQVAKNDITNLRNALNPFSTKKINSKENTAVKVKPVTVNDDSEESSSDTIPSVEGFEVEKVSEFGKSSFFEVEDKKYNQVWDASKGILEENFKIVEDNKEKGMLKGIRRSFSDSWGETVKIAISPANIPNKTYSVEVITNNKTPSLYPGYNWTPDIIRGIKYTLGMEVAIEVKKEYNRPPKKGEERPETEIIIINSLQPAAMTEVSENDKVDDLLPLDVGVEQLSSDIPVVNLQQVSSDEKVEQDMADRALQPDLTDEQFMSDDNDMEQTE